MDDTNSTTPKTTEIQIKDRALSRRKIAFSRFKRRALRHLWLVRVMLVGIVSVGIIGLIITFGLLFKDSTIGRYIKLSRNFLFTPAGEIKSANGRTNILLLGKGGAGHEAPDLTDTIIFASIDNTGSNMTLVSVPRDIWVPSIRAKVNSAYYWGNQKRPPNGGDFILRGGGGLVLAKSAVEEIVGQPIHYGVVVDFEVFINIIDVMGGVEVDVKTAFVDEKYPIPGKEDDECGDDPEYKCRYETLRFTQGKQLMDGETALKFVRSRNAEGDEGTDLAREERQQQVIDAIRKKSMSSEVVLSPKKLLELRDAFFRYIETDMENDAMAILVRYVFDLRNDVESYVIPERLLVNPDISPRYDNLYVFIPVGDNPETPENEWDGVHEWVELIIK